MTYYEVKQGLSDGVTIDLPKGEIIVKILPRDDMPADATPREIKVGDIVYGRSEFCPGDLPKLSGLDFEWGPRVVVSRGGELFVVYLDNDRKEDTFQKFEPGCYFHRLSDALKSAAAIEREYGEECIVLGKWHLLRLPEGFNAAAAKEIEYGQKCIALANRLDELAAMQEQEERDHFCEP